MAFFPLYPLLIKLFSYLFGFKLAAYFINSLALWGVIVGLFKLVKIDFKENLAWRTIFYLLLFPTAVFLTAFYTESLFLFFTVWSFYFARRQKWKFAGGVSFFATLTRIEGLAVVVFLLYEYLALKKFSFKKLDLNLVYVLSPLAGIGLYAIYLKIQFGDALLFLKSQAAWDKSFSMPWESVINYMTIFFSSRTTGYYISRDIDLIFFLVFLILSIVVFFRLRKSYGVYSLFSLFMVTFTGDLISTNRRAIILFPVLILLARWGRGVIWNFAVLILFSTLFSFFLFKFINGHWVG